MMLRELVVEGLFGELTHKITFKTPDGLTILHGPNGIGKTMTLSALDNLFNKRFRAVRNMPINSLHVEFENGDRLQVSRVNTDERKGTTLEFILSPQSGRSHTWTYKPSAEGDLPISIIDAYIPALSRIGQRTWMVDATREVLEIDDVLDRYESQLPANLVSPQKGMPAWLDEVLSSVLVYFIKADRLSTYGRSSIDRRLGREPGQTPTVNIYAGELQQQVQKTVASYGDSSQTLDSTFPVRLLTPSPAVKVPTDQDIRDHYAGQAERRNRYVKTGLLDVGNQVQLLQLPETPLTDTVELRALDLYLRDIDLKLDTLDDLAGKLELFLAIINGKFRRKQIRVDRENGLTARTASSQPLPLSSLSSGEQQEIVMAYSLLFREQPGTLILLDEPELSLHVTWQLDLIPDMLRVAEVAKIEFLIATHSPQIINDRWDLTIQLSDDEAE